MLVSKNVNNTRLPFSDVGCVAGRKDGGFQGRAEKVKWFSMPPWLSVALSPCYPRLIHYYILKKKILFINEKILKGCYRFGQEHVLTWWSELSQEEQEELIKWCSTQSHWCVFGVVDVVVVAAVHLLGLCCWIFLTIIFLPAICRTLTWRRWLKCSGSSEKSLIINPSLSLTCFLFDNFFMYFMNN